tara:strand:- start:26210 stop:26689 length:480 start_codon:yes stop_codon:yes gene_type:complete
MKIYVAGPITCQTEVENFYYKFGQVDEVDIKWREEIESKLGSNFVVLNPIRRNAQRWQSFREIIGLDKYDIQQSDLVVANLYKSSVGTSMELMYAFMLNKPTIIISQHKNLDPWIVHHSTVLVNDVNSAVNFIKQNFSQQKQNLVEQKNQNDGIQHQIR